MQFEVSRSAGGAGPSGTAETAKPVSGFDGHIQGKQNNLPAHIQDKQENPAGDSRLIEIEELVKGQKFSR